MRGRAHARILPAGRLHLQDGPIDLIIGADGLPSDIERAYSAAAARFASLLDALCAELDLIRSPAGPGQPLPKGKVARRMVSAVNPFAAEIFITPMAAVAGAVAEEILGAMTAAAPLRRAYVNNGGDIAIHLEAGADYTIGLIGGHRGNPLLGTATLTRRDGIFGIATSGWRGRSFSLGIADAVTVLAKSAAEADAAATVVANAVDLPGHPGVLREPACKLQPGSDLGSRLVTRAVAGLSAADVQAALRRGADVALELIKRNLICAAALHLQGTTKILGAKAAPLRHLREQPEAAGTSSCVLETAS